MDQEDDEESPSVNQIAQLEEAVVEMKSAFIKALQQLQYLETEDRNDKERQEQSRAHTQKQLTEALTLLIALKSELENTQQNVRTLQERTVSLERSVKSLTEERDALTQELILYGAIPPAARGRVGPGSSGAPSSDSGVALLLERAHAAFSIQPQASNSLVQDYVATLGGSVCDEEYDSESSLSVAAAKSLSLSTSLGQQCGLELENESSKKAVSRLTWRDCQRLQVARELLTAEENYAHTLHTLHTHFSEPLRTSGILAANDLNTLFPDEVWQLRNEHGILLAGLRARISTWGPGCRLGDLIQKLLSEVLGFYTSYANSFPDVLQTFHRLCRSSPPFTKFLKACLEKPECSGLDLGSLLLTPVQHMPRYVLLLRQLLNVTPAGSEEHAEIAASLAKLKDFLARLNDSMEHSFQLVAATSKHSRHERASRTEVRREIVGRRGRTQSAPRSASDWALQHDNAHHSSDDESELLVCSGSEASGISAASEPSLLKAKCSKLSTAVSVQNVNCTSKMSSAVSAQSVNSKTVSTYVARTVWNNQHQQQMIPKQKKKSSLRSSLKNLLLFRKRCVNTEKSDMDSVDKSLQGLVQQLGRMPGYIELVVYCLKETAV